MAIQPLTKCLWHCRCAVQEESAAAPNLKILEAAYRWKRQRLAGEEGGGGGGSGGE